MSQSTQTANLLQRLHQASRAIAAAESEAAVGRVLMDFAASGDLHAARLLFLVDVVDGQPTTIEMREGWTADDRPAQPYGTQLPLKDFPLLEFLQVDTIITFEDVQNDERANESVRAMMTLSGLQSFAVVPITIHHRELKDDGTQVVTSGQVWLGALIVGRNNVSSFDDELVYTLWTLADQAASAIENIRLFGQTQATLTESAMLYDASRRLTTADSLNEMMSIVAESARIPAINRVTFWTLERGADGEVIAIVQEADWYSGEGKRPMPWGTRVTLEERPSAKFMLSTETTLVRNTQTNKYMDPVTKEAFKQQNVCAMALLPLWVGKRQLGTLMLVGEKPYYFAENEIRPYRSLAGQMAVLMENRRLLEQTQAALAESKTLYDTSRRLTSAGDLQGMVAAITEGVRVPAINRAVLWVIERGAREEEAVFVSAANWQSGAGTPTLPLGTRFPLSLFPAIRMAQSAEPAFVDDILQDQRIDPMTQAVFQQQNARAVALLPLWVEERQVGTLMLVGEEPHHFSESEIGPYRLLSSQMAVRVENIRLLEQTRQSEVRFREVAFSGGNWVWEIDQQGYYSYSSEHVLDVLGYTAQEILGKHPLEFIHPDEAPHAAEILGQIMSNKQPIVNLESRVTTKSGREAVLLTNGIPILDQDGNMMGYRGMVKDITAEKRHEVELAAVMEASKAVLSTLDLEAVLLLIAKEMVKVVGAAGCTLSRWDHKADAVVTWVQWRRNWTEGHKQSPDSYALDDFPATRAVLETRRPVVISVSDPDADPAEVAFMQQTQSSRLLMLPLAVGERVIGLVELDYDEETQGDFTPEDIRLCQVLADQTAIAVENARLFDQAQREIAESERLLEALERRSKQLQTAAEVSQAASSILGLEELIQQVVDLVKERFDLYYAGLFLVQQTDASGEWAVLQADTGETGIERGYKLQVGGDSLVGWCIANKKARIALDTQDVAHSPLGTLERRDYPSLLETRSEMVLPLISWGQAIGAMTIQSAQENAFSEDDITVFQTMSDQLAAAIDNARLYDAAQARAEQERLVRTITDRIRRGANREAIMRTTLQELSHMLGASQAVIRLGTPEQLCPDPGGSKGV